MLSYVGSVYISWSKDSRQLAGLCACAEPTLVCKCQLPSPCHKLKTSPCFPRVLVGNVSVCMQVCVCVCVLWACLIWQACAEPTVMAEGQKERWTGWRGGVHLNPFALKCWLQAQIDRPPHHHHPFQDCRGRMFSVRLEHRLLNIKCNHNPKPKPNPSTNANHIHNPLKPFNFNPNPVPVPNCNANPIPNSNPKP